MKKQAYIAILGFEREGQSLLKFLQKRGLAQMAGHTRINADIWILDRDSEVRRRVGARESKRIHWQLGSGYLKNLARFNIIYRSPGIPYTLPQLYQARCDGVIVSSATKLFFEELERLPERKRPLVIGVTGSKGKGTTTTLIYEILKRGGRKTVLAGNIGRPMLDTLSAAKKAQFVILELSSFQLQDLPYSPDIAVVLDIFPDHLDAHKTLREYYGSKANIGRFQKKQDVIFYFGNNKLSRTIASKSPARKFSIIPKTDDLKKNFEMAAAVARFLGVSKEIIGNAMRSFRGLEHRMERVQTIENITFWNDSAATNPEAAVMAIRTLVESEKQHGKNGIILITGGKDKGLDYTPLAKTIQRSPHVELVVLFGENKNKIEKALVISNRKLVIQKVKNLESAVKLAYHKSQSLITNYQLPITILFSPASASFDQFQSYTDRGEQFKRIVRTLVGKRHRAL